MRASLVRGKQVAADSARRSVEPKVAPQPRRATATQAAATDVSGLRFQLKVGAQGDPFEREADAVADRVLSMPEPAAGGAGRPRPFVSHVGGTQPAAQRACASCGDEDALHGKRLAEDEVHGKLTGSAPVVSPDLEQSIRGLGAGQPLPASERAYFEPRFGHDFSHVRVHADETAQQTAASLNARAFTHGDHIVFGAGELAPGTSGGRRLMAHELTHVLQQHNGVGAVQRELATPLPATAPAAQPDLTAAQINSAITFNRSRYDSVRTKQIQDLIGTAQTGTWSEDDVRAIASHQERFGLVKDGRLGPETFRFLDNESRLERVAKTDANCLLSFRVNVDPQTVGPVVGGRRSITGHFSTEAQFSSYCGCADYQYRQFIRGHWRRERGGVVTDLGPTFATLPGGAGLPAAFIEDGNTTTPALNYGHRNQANEGTNNGYFTDAAAATQNQASGCFYRSDDTPGGPDNVVAGDVFDVLVQFRGEIRRKGAVVETKNWTAIRGRIPVP